MFRFSQNMSQYICCQYKNPKCVVLIKLLLNVKLLNRYSTNQNQVRAEVFHRSQNTIRLPELPGQHYRILHTQLWVNLPLEILYTAVLSSHLLSLTQEYMKTFLSSKTTFLFKYGIVLSIIGDCYHHNCFFCYIQVTQFHCWHGSP